MAAPAARGPLSFRAVNAPGAPGYRAGMQRHHLLPRQLLTRSWFSRLVDSLGRERLGIDDFRSNGLLLPAVEQAAQVLGLPLHRGPHTHYNQVVLERVGQIEAGWQTGHLRNPDLAQRELVMRLHLLQTGPAPQPVATQGHLRPAQPARSALANHRLQRSGRHGRGAVGGQRPKALTRKIPAPETSALGLQGVPVLGQ